MATTTKTLVRARVDGHRKIKTERIFKRYGLTTSEAVNIFLAKVEEVDGMPFDLRPDETRELMANPEFVAHLARIHTGTVKYTDAADLKE